MRYARRMKEIIKQKKSKRQEYLNPVININLSAPQSPSREMTTEEKDTLRKKKNLRKFKNSGGAPDWRGWED